MQLSNQWMQCKMNLGSAQILNVDCGIKLIKETSGLRCPAFCCLNFKILSACEISNVLEASRFISWKLKPDVVYFCFCSSEHSNIPSSEQTASMKCEQ